MIIVYTGNGKGKTSACIGQAMRALGRDFAVGFGQFMKQPGCAGEQTVLARLLGDDFLAGGKGFLRREEDRPPTGKRPWPHWTGPGSVWNVWTCWCWTRRSTR